LITHPTASAWGYEFTTVDHPQAVNGTFPLSVQGSTVVGFYRDSNLHEHGFSFDGSTYTTLDHPSAGGTTAYYGTIAYDVWGTTIVGTYSDGSRTSGFVYAGSNWTSFRVADQATLARGVYGSDIVGFYSAPATSTSHGFLYDGVSYTTLDHPLAVGQTYPRDIWGSTIAGYYASGGVHGFTYDGATYTTLDHPLASALFSGDGTYAVGISGSTVVGWYDRDSLDHGFTYDGSTWSTIDHPLGARGTEIWGVSGNTLVGVYTDSSSQFHGFIATVPEPGGAITIGVLLWYGWARRVQGKIVVVKPRSSADLI